MGCGAIVAVGQATVDGHSLFAHALQRPIRQPTLLRRIPGRDHAPGERLRTQTLELIQPRRTFTVVGTYAPGSWGLDRGVNEHGVAMGCVPLPPLSLDQRSGLNGRDLVRLTLERSHSALQAVDVLADLVARNGHAGAGSSEDDAFIIADPKEAYVIETAGSYWVYQEVREVRAVQPVRVIRQDWDRISNGLAGLAIDKGLWPADGSKLDFAGALDQSGRAQAALLKSWARTTLLLQEQNGHLDASCARRILAETMEAPQTPNLGLTTFVAELRLSAGIPVVWFTLDVQGVAVQLPVFLHGDLPAGLTGKDADVPATTAESGMFIRPRWAANPALCAEEPTIWGLLNQWSGQIELETMQDVFARLQTVLDQETEEFLHELCTVDRAASELHRQTSVFMQHQWERLRDAVQQITVRAAEIGAGV